MFYISEYLNGRTRESKGVKITFKFAQNVFAQNVFAQQVHFYNSLKMYLLKIDIAQMVGHRQLHTSVKLSRHIRARFRTPTP